MSTTKSAIKGIILAAGSGSRLFPLSSVVSKALLPIYDKPMLFYPLSTLLSAGVRDFLIVTTPESLPHIQKLLGNGERLGISICYETQATPEGPLQALFLAEKFVQDEPCALVFGDNIFYGEDFGDVVKNAADRAAQGISTLFGYYVEDPRPFGVWELDGDKIVAIEEKPAQPKSNYIVPGMYFYGKNMTSYLRELLANPKKDLSISDLNRLYLQRENIHLQLLGPEYVWLDTGTPAFLHQAAQFVHERQQERSMIIASPEAVAFENGWIDSGELLKNAEPYSNTLYGQYLRQLAGE